MSAFVGVAVAVFVGRGVAVGAGVFVGSGVEVLVAVFCGLGFASAIVFTGVGAAVSSSTMAGVGMLLAGVVDTSFGMVSVGAFVGTVVLVGGTAVGVAVTDGALVETFVGVAAAVLLGRGVVVAAAVGADDFCGVTISGTAGAPPPTTKLTEKEFAVPLCAFEGTTSSAERSSTNRS